MATMSSSLASKFSSSLLLAVLHCSVLVTSKIQPFDSHFATELAGDTLSVAVCDGFPVVFVAHYILTIK